MLINGSKGSITASAFEPRFTVSLPEGEEQVEIPDGEGEWTVEHDFVQAVRSGRKGSPSFSDGVRYVAFTQAVYDSIREDGQMKPVESGLTREGER